MKIKSWIESIFPTEKNKLRIKNQKNTLLTILVGILIILSIYALNILYTDYSQDPETNVITNLDDLSSMNPTTMEDLPNEVQQNIREKVNGFQGGFMRSPDSPYYYLKSPSATMIFKESEITVRIPEYTVVTEDGKTEFSGKKNMKTQISDYTDIILHFPSSNKVNPTTLEPQSAKYNYFKGDESQWIRNTPYYKKLVYKNIYDKIDLVYDLTNGELKYEFHVYPGGDYTQIEIQWLGDVSIEKNEYGIIISVLTGSSIFAINDNNPINFNDQDRKKNVEGEFILEDDHSYNFLIEDYDKNSILIIDPLMDLQMSTFLGGTYSDSGSAIALDNSNNVYIIGYTYSSDFPITIGAFNGTFSSKRDVFVSKLSSDGQSLIFSTFLGGGEDDIGVDIVLDSINNVYITGYTYNSTTKFPTTSGAYDESYIGDADVFVTKLAANGSSLIFSSLIGGSGYEYVSAIKLDTSNRPYITGYTADAAVDFPTTSGVYDETHNGVTDVFITRFSSNGGSIISTLIGGSDRDGGLDLILDNSNDVYIAGYSNDSVGVDYPSTPGVFHETHNIDFDAFITKLSADLTTLQFSTFIGNTGSDRGIALALDSSNNIVISGYTTSTDFSTTNGAFDTTPNGNNDVFISKLSSDGSTLINSTLIGGSGIDFLYDMKLDNSDTVYITGEAFQTINNNYPTTSGAYNETHNGYIDAFITVVSSDLSTLNYSSLFGGSYTDRGSGITLDSANNIYITGASWNSSINLPTTTGTYGQTNAGEYDAFIVRFVFQENTIPEISGRSINYFDINESERNITLDFGDISPSYFDVSVDGILLSQNNPWKNGSITWNINNNELGTYNYTFWVYDLWGNVNAFSSIVIITHLDLQNDFTFSTFLGGIYDENSWAITLDSFNNIYIIGETLSNDFPVTLVSINGSINGLTDVFITKLLSSGTDIVYSTYIGGGSDDIGRDIKLDFNNDIYIIGDTYSNDFPITTGALYSTNSGSSDVFVAKLTSDGSDFIFSTYIGGLGDDFGMQLAIDISNNVYFCGASKIEDSNYPTTLGAYSQVNGGGFDVFISKLSSNGSTLLFSTFIGGLANEYATSLVLDSSNNVYITGYAGYSVVPYPTTPGAYDQAHAGGNDAFISKLSSNGSDLLFSTFLGGLGNDFGESIKLDASDNVYIAGYTENTTSNFPATPWAYNEKNSGGYDAFVSKLSSDGTNLMYSTFIGGSGNDYAYSVTLDTSGYLYLTGSTENSSITFPTTVGSYNVTHNGGEDVFLTKISPDLSTPVFSTLIGGSGMDTAYDVAFAKNEVYLIGYTHDDVTDFPTSANAINGSIFGGNDVFISIFRSQEFTLPMISTSWNSNYEYDTLGNQLFWNVGDVNPGTYNITRNGNPIVFNQTWNNGSVTLDIDGLALGNYNYTIYLQDHWGNLVSNSILVTVRDTTSPNIIIPDDLSIEFGSTKNSLSWDLSDSLPDVYNITLDGNLYNSTSSWTNGIIMTNIDELSLGSHQITISVYDSSGNSKSATTIISVIDTTKPAVTNPSDISYTVLSTGNQIGWIASDLDPSTYTIYLNGSEYRSGDWKSNEQVVLSVDSLRPNTYNFTIVFYDGSGNQGIDAIIVKVIDNTDPLVNEGRFQSDNSNVEEGGNVIIIIEDVGQIDYIQYSWNDGELITMTYTPDSLLLSQDVQQFQFLIPVPSGLLGSQKLTIIAYDHSGNSSKFTLFVTIHKTENPIITFLKEQILIVIGLLILLIFLIILTTRSRGYKRKFTNKLEKIENIDVFISYSSKDSSLAEKLFDELYQAKLNPWIAADNIGIGEKYNEEIIKAIDGSKIFIILVSESSVSSRHVGTELERAFSKNKQIFPIRLDKCELPVGWEYFLSQSQWKDYSDYKNSDWVYELASMIEQHVELATEHLNISQDVNRSQTAGTSNTSPISNATISTIPEEAKCLFCDNTVLPEHTSCPNCGQFDPFLKRPLKRGESWTTCYNCFQAFQRGTFLEWVRTKGRCPSCKERVQESRYTDYLSQSEVAEKIKATVAMDLGIKSDDLREISQIQRSTVNALDNLQKIYHTMLVQNEDLRKRIDTLEMTVGESQDKVLAMIQPIAEELVRVSELNKRLETNMLTQQQFEVGIEAVTKKLDALEEQVDILFEYHKKENSMRKKLENNLKSKAVDVTLDTAIQETGIQDDLASYSDSPTKFKLHSIIGKIKFGLKNSVGDPKKWLKLTSLLFFI